ncbi:hypothetical protein PQQ86_35925 [Paraburkholderia sediminicola]|uniref:hypothetical protein n=1 Tax=Paraburkholderia sediminicola TaxID=458836 RepID=UPI0038BC8C3B
MISDFYRLRGSFSIISTQIRAPILIFNQHETAACSVADDRSSIADAQRAGRVSDIQTAD